MCCVALRDRSSSKTKKKQKFEQVGKHHPIPFPPCSTPTPQPSYFLKEKFGKWTQIKLRKTFQQSKGRLQNPTAAWPAVPSGSAWFLLFKQWQPPRTGQNCRSTAGWVLKSPLTQLIQIFYLRVVKVCGPPADWGNEHEARGWACSARQTQIGLVRARTQVNYIIFICRDSFFSDWKVYLHSVCWTNVSKPDASAT